MRTRANPRLKLTGAATYKKEDVKRYFPRGRPVLFFCIFKGHPVPPPHAVASRDFVSGRCNVPEVVPLLRVDAVNFGLSGNHKSRPATYRELYL